MDIVLVTSVCEDERFMFTQCKSISVLYMSYRFLVDLIYTRHFLVTKPDQYLYFDVYIHNLEWCGTTTL